ncbi:hypothetical protein YH66_02680 [[Brevibacterium] flavum]|uniref:Uncharacterized protein n=1 Tax=[Brevibacterium] flavum TaxID=92706 RepID=A0A0F6Z4C3_9CORY|nr:hypothetical protein YH66_02680 [[Brevibacterium] flavum]AST19766.1 hypothetical protein CEY17_02705 [Corynebacterium glutamicum ATCC 14067]KIH74497.1 hypothetical protein SD36_02750 [Corynebacterium glutamicum]KEI22222.1 hypothetical protein KIQ_006485 [Corynebacterium glutamicum ATCC 14067]QDX74717.1 hypothetical protein AKL15_02615 [Corynebacterium glutamicum]
MNTLDLVLLFNQIKGVFCFIKGSFTCSRYVLINIARVRGINVLSKVEHRAAIVLDQMSARKIVIAPG